MRLDEQISSLRSGDLGFGDRVSGHHVDFARQTLAYDIKRKRTPASVHTGNYNNHVLVACHATALIFKTQGKPF